MDERCELADKLVERFRQGKNAVLSPETALRVATALRIASAAPRREEIMAAICARKGPVCPAGTTCDCLMRANVIMQLYERGAREGGA